MSSPRVGDRVTEKGMTGQVVALRPQNMVDVVFDGRDYPMRRPASSLTVVRENPPKPKMPVFAAAVLTPEAKKALYRWWSTLPLAPDPLPILKSSHMTIKFRPSIEEVSLMPLGQEVTLQVTGWAGDGKIQAVSIEPVGVGSANAIPHVTFAIKDPSVAPKLSNELFGSPDARKQSIRGPALTARVGWSDGGTYYFEPPVVQGNPGPRGGLSAAERSSLRTSDFALPGRRWPINDRRHAVIAMQYMLRGFGNHSDYPQILAAIERKYPRSDRRNAEIWEFHAKHFGSPARMVANPARDVYDPAQEQLRARTQGIYETEVRRLLGLHYKTPFMDESGRRLDAALDPETTRKLVRKAHAIATAVEQRDGNLIPGTRTPTEKGRARAYERLSAENVQHASVNRQDYERTLARARKGPHFRVVAQEVDIGRGRTTTHYIVQPRPDGLVSIPPYRLSERAAQLDANRAEQAFTRASDTTRVRYNPRKGRAAGPHTNVREEALFEKRIEEFAALPLERATAALRATGRALRLAEATARLQARRDGTDPDLVELSPDALRFLQAKLDARNDLPFTTAEEVLASAGPVIDLPYETDSTYIQTEVYRRFPAIGSTIPLAKWTEYQIALQGDLVRNATEGAKVGGIAGSNKNRADSSGPEKVYRDAMADFNRTLPPDVLSFGGTLNEKAALVVHELDPSKPLKIKPFEFDDSFMLTIYKPKSELAALSMDQLSERERKGEIYDDEIPEDWRITEEEQGEDGWFNENTRYFKLVPSNKFDPKPDTDYRFDGPLLRRGAVRAALAKFPSDQEVYLIELDILSLLNDPDRNHVLWRNVPGIGFSPSVRVPLYGERVNRKTGEVEKTGVVVRSFIVPRDSSGNKDPGREFEPGARTARILTRTPITFKTLTVVPRPNEDVKSARQETSLDDQQEKRELKKFIATAARLQETTAFYDVERVVLLYKMDESDPAHPKKRYFTYTLLPDETLEDVMRKFDFQPGVTAEGLPEPLPKVETRYVVYIPRTPRFIKKRVMAGGTTILGDTRGLKGYGKVRSKGLAMEDQPEGKRPRSKLGGYTEFGISSIDSFKVYPSMILQKYFRVDPDGLGGEEKLEQAVTESAATKQNEVLLDDLGAAPVAIDAAQMAAFASAMELRYKPKAGIAKRIFQSPDENWVKYKRATNMFRRLRQGVFNTITNQYEGGIKDLQMFDVFYTNNAALAYLTIMYFNTPGALPHVDTEIVSVRNVLRAIKTEPVRVVEGNRQHLLEVDRMEMIESESLITKPKITKKLVHETAEQARGGILTPLAPRQPLSVSTVFFDSTALGLLMQRMTIEEMEMSMAGIMSRSAINFERREARLRKQMERERKVRAAISAAASGAQASQAAGRTRPQVTQRPAPAPVVTAVPDVDVSDLDLDFNNNPFTRRRRALSRPTYRTRR